MSSEVVPKHKLSLTNNQNAATRINIAQITPSENYPWCLLFIYVPIFLFCFKIDDIKPEDAKTSDFCFWHPTELIDQTVNMPY